MTHDEMLKHLAPCGLDCTRCATFGGGKVAGLSRELSSALEGFDKMAQRMAGFFEPFGQYDSFVRILEFFSGASCRGCRQGGGQYPGCKAKGCTEEKGVNFCGECDEFPCMKNRFNPDLQDKWVKNGEIIRSKGAPALYRHQQDKPRY